MYNYAAGSPGTFSGPRTIDTMGPGYGMGTYLQMGHKLSYAPRFSGYGADAAATAPAAATGTDWSSVVNASIAGVMGIFQISQAQRLATQQRHQMERDAAMQAENARAATLYSQSFKPAPGTTMTTTSGGGGGGMGSTAMLLGGVAAAGGLAWMLMGRRRRGRR